MTINIDFDVTVTTHDYPSIGKDIGAQKVLKRLTDSGHQLILFTMRSGKELDDSINWFKQNNMEYKLILLNLPGQPHQKV